ncbi:MAG: amino acid ABC transporter permease [Actinobacteria bacterium]|nr:amino acid ABC transporter permease [Actinomycetota bacterium]
MNLNGVNFRWSLIWENRAILLKGLATAIQVSITSLVISLVIGLILALARMSSKRAVAIIASSYVSVFRGIPALVSVIWVYFGWSLLFGHNFTVYQAGVIALTLLYSAFFCEIYRAALMAVAKGQREAGLALGMTRIRIFVSIIMPQATKIAIPNIGSMYIGMVKDTSTFAVIGLVEVVRVTQNLNSVNFQPFVLYTAAAVLYVVLAFIVDFIFRAIEKNLSTPPSGRLSNVLTRRRRERIEALINKTG